MMKILPVEESMSASEKRRRRAENRKAMYAQLEAETRNHPEAELSEEEMVQARQMIRDLLKKEFPKLKF